MEMDIPLPTPPRSPAPAAQHPAHPHQQIKTEPDDFLDDSFEDIFGLLSNSSLEEVDRCGRKRNMSDLFGSDMEELLRDFPHSHTHFLTTPPPPLPPLPPPPHPSTFDFQNSLLDSLIQNLDTCITTPPPTRPPSPTTTTTTDDQFEFQNYIKVEQDSDQDHSPSPLSDFLSTFSTDFNFSPNYDLFSPKRPRLDSDSSSSLITDDCFLYQQDIKPEPAPALAVETLRSAIANDHNYCGGEDSVVLDGVELYSGLLNFDNIPKKTKILVPLKSLMKTLQQKSFLVSPCGPGKKVIRLTGAGESVKGVLQSTSLLTHASSTNPSTPPKNPRKRPHSNLLNSKILKEELPPPPPSPDATNPKKKTKAHNNMERMRRIDLRNSFDNLKKLVPILSKSPKCSKVEILRRAEEYVRGLRGVEKKLVKEEGLLKVRMGELKGRLQAM